MQDNPNLHDAKPMLGCENYTRVDVGEYRIIYRFESEKDKITVVLIGKHNDNEIYRISKRALK